MLLAGTINTKSVKVEALNVDENDDLLIIFENP